MYPVMQEDHPRLRRKRKAAKTAEEVRRAFNDLRSAKSELRRLLNLPTAGSRTLRVAPAANDVRYRYADTNMVAVETLEGMMEGLAEDALLATASAPFDNLNAHDAMVKREVEGWKIALQNEQFAANRSAALQRRAWRDGARERQLIGLQRRRAAEQWRWNRG